MHNSLLNAANSIAGMLQDLIGCRAIFLDCPFYKYISYSNVMRRTDALLVSGKPVLVIIYNNRAFSFNISAYYV